RPSLSLLNLSVWLFLMKINDPSPTNQRLNKNVNNDVSLRLHNLTVLTRQIRMYYQVCTQTMPRVSKSMEELKRLLLLLLGCAVQCERKEEMIEKIKLLDIETQAAIVSHIQEVTHNQLNVLDLSWLEEGTELVHEELEPMSRNMAVSLRQLIDQRDKANEFIVDLTQERDYLSSQQPQEGCRSLGLSSSERGQSSGDARVNSGGSAATVPGLTKEEKQHLSVELADTKAKLRRYRQELEEKTEQLMDSKHEVERQDQELQRLKQENQSLSCEARSVRVYRDEVDALRERASRVDRLETELTRCKEKLNDVHFYKTRVEELREDNLTLMETKVLLEEQLSASRGRCDKLHTLEKDNLLLRAKIHDLEMERDNERRRLEELVEENMLLEIGQKQSMNESAHLGWELEQLTKNHDNTNTETRKSLVHELNECVSSRVLKLEKENRELQASIERLKEDNHLLQEQQLHSQELDRENQSLSKKLERLQGLLDQEKLTNQDMESLGEEILKEKQNLEREIHALRAQKDRQISELENEKQHLSDAVASLRDRAQSNSEARVREVEAQNRLLHQNITDTSSRVASLETELKLASEEAKRLREKAGRCEEVEREAARLERSRDSLNREVIIKVTEHERSETLEKQVSSLEQEVHKLKREADEAQRELQRLGKHEAESGLLTKENLDLRCSLENLRSSSARLATLQEEHKEAQKEVQELQRRIEEAREEAQGERKRAERLELNIASLNQEKHRLEEQIERSKEEKEEIDRERQEAQSKEEELRREVEELREERKRREDGDEERRKLQLDLEQSEKGRKHLEKESWRMRTLLDSKDSELEEKTRQVNTLKKEGLALSKEVDRLKETAVKAKEVEKENKELQKQATIDKRTLATLREVRQQHKCTKNTDQRRISLLHLLPPLCFPYWSSIGHSFCFGYFYFSQNASLQTENSLLKEQLKQLENQNTSQNNQMVTLQRHTSTLQEQNSSLHTQTAKLQVENSTLSSQSASLMAQNAVLQGQVTALETEAESWQRQREEAWRGRESVLSDHERLLSVHERQAHEYEQLISQHAALKSKQRGLESEHRALHNKYCVLLQQKDKWEEQEGRGQKEKEELNQEIQKNRLLQQENLQLKTDVDRLTEIQSQQSEQSEGLQQRMNDLKSSLSTAQLEVSRWMARYDSLMEQHQGLDLTMTKLDNHCELLSRLKGNLEEENHHLLSQINLLSQQNHTLLERSMESKELYHQEQKLYIDKLNALRRQKEKLEEKIMDQYKFYDPTPKKRSQWSGAKALVKLIKPRKESSRERVGDRDKDGGKDRERAKSAPDIPLPAPPPLLPPETPPPVPQRTLSDSQDTSHTHSNHNNHTSSPSLGPRSPALTPINRGKSTDSALLHGFIAYAFSSPLPSRFFSMSDSSDRQVRSASLSSDDVMGLSQSQQTLSRSSTLPYDHTPQRAQPQRGGPARSKTRPSSPGSEMVTLEEFLHESNLQSPPMVKNTWILFKCIYCFPKRSTNTHNISLQSRPSLLPVKQNCTPMAVKHEITLSHIKKKLLNQYYKPVSTGSREDLMTDYFRSPAPSAPAGRDQVTPTSYVTPTVQSSNQRPGQSVKPSPRQPVGQSPASAQPLTQRTSQSLSRTFSLASADLLRSNGPDSFRGNEGSPGQSDVVVRRQGGGANGRERPLSARLAGPTNQHGDASFLHTPIHHSSSLNLQTERFAERERVRTSSTRNGPTSSSTYHHRGEVAMVTPVRAVPATRSDDVPDQGEGLREGRSGDSTHIKKDSDRARCSSVERPKSTPASPDPNNDPQTVWYEYGCV
uniref:Protein Daple-like n=1 Tax=Sphaeramia orbicularis TaxID=375764 RepID=A0A673CXT2_9TELE